MWLTADDEDAVEKVSDVDAGVRDHRRQLLPQLEFLPDDHHAAQVLQGRFPLRHRQGHTLQQVILSYYARRRHRLKLECGPMPNVMVALPNIGGALCSTPQSLADAHY